MPSARKRQTRLAFSPLPSSSPASKTYHQQIRDRAAAVTIDGNTIPNKRRRLDVYAPPAIPTPVATLELDDEDDEEPVRAPQARSTPRSSALQRDHGSASTSKRLSKAPKRSSGSSMFKSQPIEGLQTIRSEESESSEDLPAIRKIMSSPGRRSSKRRSKKSEIQGPASDSVNSRGRPVAAHSSDDEDEMPTTLGKKRRRKRAPSADSFVSSSPPHAAAPSDDDDDVIVVSDSRAAKPHKASSEDEDEDDVPKTPGRRRLLKRPRIMTQQEKEDLDEDLDFLQPSEDERREPISTQSAQKNAKQQALERLKLRRSGVTAIPEAEEEEEESVLGKPDDEEHSDSEDDQGTSDSEQPPIVSSRQMFTATQDDDDFLEEDDNDADAGLAGNIPIEFTHFAREKPKNLFKFAVEWFVQKKINPAFDMSDEIYDLTFKKLDDEVKGMAGSKFMSSAWTPNFTIALNARPEIAVDHMGSSAFFDKCDACNRTGHPATYVVRFIGKPYHQETLEEVEEKDADDSDSDSDSSSSSDTSRKTDAVDHDSKGRKVPPESTTFAVGKFCTANAKTAHALQHWRFHLNEWVVTWLISHGYCTAEALLERDRWSTKKRRRRANKIVDRMEDEGVVKRLWKEFRNTSDMARSSKQGRYDLGSP